MAGRHSTMDTKKGVEQRATVLRRVRDSASRMCTGMQDAAKAPGAGEIQVQSRMPDAMRRTENIPLFHLAEFNLI